MPVRQPKTTKKTDIASRKLPPIERYSDERVAEFLLSNTVDTEDYTRAVKLVRKLGLDPEKIEHDKPIGVA